MRTAFTSLFCCLILFGCRGGPPSQTITVKSNEKETKAEILKFIPIGMPLCQAEDTMVKSGFTRIRPTPGRPAKGNCPPMPAWTVDESSYLLYYIDTPDGFMTTRTWYVQLYHKTGTVEDIKVTPGGLTGL